MPCNIVKVIIIIIIIKYNHKEYTLEQVLIAERSSFGGLGTEMKTPKVSKLCSVLTKFRRTFDNIVHTPKWPLSSLKYP